VSASTELPLGELTTHRAGAGARAAAFRRVASRPAGAIGIVVTVGMALTALFAGSIATSSPYQADDRELLSPSWTYPMGTNGLGRDLFSSVVYGIRTSMTVVFWVVLISSVIGVAVGAVSGYRGGLVDDALMRVAELFQVVPRFFLALMVLALFGPDLRNLIFLLGFTSWPLLAKVVRAEALALRDREFVQAAVSLGAAPVRVLVRHIVPNILPAALVVIALTASRVILIEATLRYLGLGDPNVVSLGSLARDSQAYLEIAWWMSVFPGLAIVASGIGLNLVADALNQSLNPRASEAVAHRATSAFPRTRGRSPLRATKGRLS
jgi:peptide/nickel transport system permease protein